MGLGKGLSRFKRIAKHTPGGVEHDQEKHGDWSTGMGVKTTDPVATVAEANPRLRPKPNTESIYERVGEIQSSPEWQENPNGPAGDEANALFAEARSLKTAWVQDLEDAITLGEITPEDAADQYDYRPQNVTSHNWQPLPDTVYHVTTAGTAIREGGILSRDEVNALHGETEGLGGGASDTISLTGDPEIAYDIHNAMLELHDVTTGKITFDDMRTAAMLGNVGSLVEGSEGKTGKPFWQKWLGGKDPQLIEDIESGTRRWHDYTGHEGREAAVAAILKMDPEATDIQSVGEPFGKNKNVWYDWTYKRGPKARLEQTVDLFKGFLSSREYNGGGPTDPLFWGFGADEAVRYRATPRDEIQLLTYKPSSDKIMGQKLNALDEYRVTTGEALTLIPDADTRVAKRLGIAKHYGPGPHKTGTSQDEHGRKIAGTGVTPRDLLFDGPIVDPSNDELLAQLQATSLPVKDYEFRDTSLWVELEDGRRIVFGNPPGEWVGQGVVSRPLGRYVTEQIKAVDAVYSSKKGRALWDAIDSNLTIQFTDVEGASGQFVRPLVGDMEPEMAAQIRSGIFIETRGFKLEGGKVVPDAGTPRTAWAMEDTLVHEMGHALDYDTRSYEYYPVGGGGEGGRTLYFSSLAFDDYGWTRASTGTGFTTETARPEGVPGRPEGVPDLDVLFDRVKGSFMYSDQLSKGQRSAWAYPASTAFKKGNQAAVKEFYAEAVRYWYQKPAVLKGLVRVTNSRELKRFERSRPFGSGPETRQPPPPMDDRVLVDWVEFGLRKAGVDVPVTKAADQDVEFFDVVFDPDFEWPEGMSPEELAAVIGSAPVEKHYGPGPHKSGSSQDVHGKKGADTPPGKPSGWERLVHGRNEVRPLGPYFPTVGGNRRGALGWNRNYPNSIDREFQVYGRKVTLRSAHGEAAAVSEFPPAMAEAIRAVPESTWYIADYPKLVVVKDSIGLAHALSPTSEETITGSGLYIMPEGNPYYSFTPDGEHVVYISMQDDMVARWRMDSNGDWVEPVYREHTAVDLKNNLIHELGHAVTMPHLAGDEAPDRAKNGQVRMYMRDLFNNTPKHDRMDLLKHISEEKTIEDDPWLYPKMTAGSKGVPEWELAAEAFMYMSIGARPVVDQADSYAEGPFALDMTDWLDSLYPGGSVPVAKRKLTGFSGKCGVTQLSAMRIEKHYPGGKDHDQMNHGRRGGKIGMDQPSLLVDQPGLFDDVKPTPRVPVKIGPSLDIKDAYVFGIKDVADDTGYYMGMLTNHDEVNRVMEHIEKDPVGALKGLGEHWKWIDDQVTKPEGQRLFTDKDQGDPWNWEVQETQALMIHAAEKAEPILIERGYEIKAEIEAAMPDQQYGPTRADTASMIPYSTREPTMRDFKEYIAKNHPEHLEAVEAAQAEGDAATVKSLKSRDVYQYYRKLEEGATLTRTRERESGIESRWDEHVAISRDVFTPATLKLYDGRHSVREAIADSPALMGRGAGVIYGESDKIDLTRPQTIEVTLEDGFGYMESLEDVRLSTGVEGSSYRRYRTPEEGDLVVGEPFEGRFYYTPPESSMDLKNAWKIRRNSSLYDEGMLPPLFISKDWTEARKELSAHHRDDPGNVVMTGSTYRSLMYNEAQRLSKSAFRQEKKSIDALQHVGAELKQAKGREQVVIDTLSEHREMGGDLAIAGAKTKAKVQLQLAADAYPTDWVERSGEAGAIRVKGKPYARAYYYNEISRRTRRNRKTGTGGQYVYESSITVDPNGILTDDTLHELGHRMEHVVPEIRFVERSFWKRRTEGQPWERLSVLTGNKNYKREMTKPDKFGIPYMGKQYGNPAPSLHRGDGFVTSTEAYELLSTAYPVITGRSKNKLDPEHEALILGILAEL